ncbi:DUF397 domain-containing protein [Shimazuella soli]|uniref:DUF397 domain-containing protein n=1 Tax=Shimazuella soli TaxID=1892854 RepID=UPI003B8399D0
MALERGVWTKSSESGGNGGNCVEVCASDTVGSSVATVIEVRDSKRVSGPTFTVSSGAWEAFIQTFKP